MKFERTQDGVIKARQWLLDNDMTDRCDAGRGDDGFTFIDCCNDLFYKYESSPYFLFAEIVNRLKELKELSRTGCLGIQAFDHLEVQIGDMVSEFTNLLVEAENYE